MKDNVFVFHVPNIEGELEYTDIFDNINQSMQFLNLKPLQDNKVDFKNIAISTKSLELAY